MTSLTKVCLFGFLAGMLGLFVLMFIPYPPAQAEAGRYFTEDDIAIGLQYSFERRWFVVASFFLHFGLLCVFALTSVGRRCADRLLLLSGNRRVITALGMVLLWLLTYEILSLPIGVARLYHAQYWGMSNLDLASWLQDHFLAFALTLAVHAIVLAGGYSLMIGFPRFWWLLATVGTGMLAVAYAFLAPLLIDPLFNDFTPLSQTEWRALQPRVESLLGRAGVPVQEIMVMNASRRSNHSNAYFTGFGSSRQIVLYDTLLKNHSPEEIESVLAHEIGHWQHDHIVTGIFLGMWGVLLGLAVLDRILRFAVGRAPWFLQSIADPAGVPLVLLLFYVAGWLALPVENAVSRLFERQADQVSLELGRQPKAFIDTEIKMARQNKANVAPSPWNTWLFASHPSTVERIRAAERWKK